MDSLPPNSLLLSVNSDRVIDGGQCTSLYGENSSNDTGSFGIWLLPEGPFGTDTSCHSAIVPQFATGSNANAPIHY